MGEAVPDEILPVYVNVVVKMYYKSIHTKLEVRMRIR